MQRRRKIQFEDRVTTRIYDPTEPVEITLTPEKDDKEIVKESEKDRIISNKYQKICQAQGINESYIETIVKTLTSSFHETPSARLYTLETILKIADFPYFSSMTSIDIRHTFDLLRKNKKTKK